MSKKMEKLLKEAEEKNLLVIVFNDTETTGATEEDRIIQSAHAVCFFDKTTNKIEFKHYMEEYIMPPLPIKPGAAVVHGIWKQDLIGAKPWINSKSKEELEYLCKNGAHYVAHNSPFDIKMLSKEGINWPLNKIFDTLRVARNIYLDNTELESRGLQYIRYFYDFDSKEDFADFVKQFKVKKLQAHTALSDIIVLMYFFKFMFEEKLVNSIEELFELSYKISHEDILNYGNTLPKTEKISILVKGTYLNRGKITPNMEFLHWAVSCKDKYKPSFSKKVAIAYFAIEALRKKEMEYSVSLTPMFYLSSAFIPEQWDFLTELNIDIFDFFLKTHKKVKDNIEELKNNPADKKELEFLSSDYEAAKKYVLPKLMNRLIEKNELEKIEIIKENFSELSGL